MRSVRCVKWIAEIYFNINYIYFLLSGQVKHGTLATFRNKKLQIWSETPRDDDAERWKTIYIYRAEGNKKKNWLIIHYHNLISEIAATTTRSSASGLRKKAKTEREIISGVHLIILDNVWRTLEIKNLLRLWLEINPENIECRTVASRQAGRQAGREQAGRQGGSRHHRRRQQLLRRVVGALISKNDRKKQTKLLGSLMT